MEGKLLDTDSTENKPSSAYTIALKHGFKGSEEEWLESLKGSSAYDIAVKNGFDGSEADWLTSLKGMDAFDTWRINYRDFDSSRKITRSEWAEMVLNPKVQIDSINEIKNNMAKADNNVKASDINAEKAEESAKKAEECNLAAKDSADNAADSASLADISEESAKKSAESAKSYADDAMASAVEAKKSAESAKKDALSIKEASETAASNANMSSESASAAASSADKAKESENAARRYSNTAKNNADAAAENLKSITAMKETVISVSSNAASDKAEVSSALSEIKNIQKDVESSTESSKRWAVYEQSPDGNKDDNSTTGLTCSSKTWALDAKKAAKSAEASAEIAGRSEVTAKDSADAASDSEEYASQSAVDAQTYSDESSINASNAKSSANSAAASETNAKMSETNASASMQEAVKSAKSAASDSADAKKAAEDAKQALSDIKNTLGAAAKAFRYMGSLKTYADLPKDGMEIGHVYNIETANDDPKINAGENVVWNGTAWDPQGGIVDLSDYVKRNELDSYVKSSESGGLSVTKASNADEATHSLSSDTADKAKADIKGQSITDYIYAITSTDSGLDIAKGSGVISSIDIKHSAKSDEAIHAASSDLASKLSVPVSINGVSFDGSADITISNVTSASTDNTGQQINSTYIKSVSAKDATVTVTRGNNESTNFTINNVNNAVHAGISDSCTGNSATATKATQDSAGQQINSTYIKGLSVSGKTITYTRGNNTTGTITTQDTVYTHPNSGVNAGTYKSVTVNAQGHVTGGSNPTTLSGYGITDAPTKTGDGASGTWGISISGKANTATSATNADTAQVANKVNFTIGDEIVFNRNGQNNGGDVWIGYRNLGATSPITTYRFGDGLAHGGLANISAKTFVGNLSGNAATATKLLNKTVLTVKSFDSATGTLELTSI